VNAAELNAHLDRVLVGGREPAHIVIADSQSDWPERFQYHRARIAAALETQAERVEHIGSTSVPGLAAKPVIDVLVVVTDPEAPDVRLALERGGYVLRVDEPGHRMFRTASRDVHVHVWPSGSREVTRYLAFRDRLRADESDRTAYEALKRQLADREWDDMNHYAAAKSELIEAILRRAQAD
jgi:GrpB-like predicted nucleotidyltransferase (UPF0157 family)